jgi:hypothetical protein
MNTYPFLRNLRYKKVKNEIKLSACEMSRIPYCLDNLPIDGGNDVRPTQPAVLY